MKKFAFEEPKSIYRGLDLWMVNGKLECDEVARQVREFKDKGLYSVIFRTYDGIISDYPGPDFKKALQTAIDTAKECGIKIMLQAGYMPAAVPNLPREYALRRIKVFKEGEDIEGRKILSWSNGFIFTKDVCPTALNMLDGKAAEYYITNFYEELWKDFSCEYGKTIEGLWVDEPRFENTYLLWEENMEEIFFDKYGYSITENIPSLYFDIKDYKKVRYDYYALLRDLLEKNYYSNVRKWCNQHNLTQNGHLMAEEELWMQISQSVAVMPYYKYFDIPGIDMLNLNHDWYDKPINSNDKASTHHSTRTKWIAPVQCVSMARQMGREHTLCEMYAVTTPSLNFRDMMHMFDRFASCGINHQCIHALFYTIKGFRKRFYPQSFNTYQPFWKDFRKIKDYVAHVSNFVTIGNETHKVLVLHPLETAYGIIRGLTDTNDTNPRRALIDYDEKYFYKLICDLYSSNIPFHFGDLSSIETLGDVDEDSFVIGKMKYKTLVIPHIDTITKKMLSLMKTFGKNGGKIIITGELPERLDGEYLPTLKDEISNIPNVIIPDSKREFISLLKETHCDYTLESTSTTAKTLINHRKDGDYNFFMFHNTDCRKKKTHTLLIKGTHRAFEYNPESNTKKEIYCYTKDMCTYIPFTIHTGSSAFIITEKCDEISCLTPPSTIKTIIPMKDISIERKDKNLLTLELCNYKTEKDQEFSKELHLTERVARMLTEKKYTGRVWMKFTFYAEKTDDLSLVMEESEAHEIVINDRVYNFQSTGYFLDKSMEISDLKDYIVKGKNTIIVSRHTFPNQRKAVSDKMEHLFELFSTPKKVDLERIYIMGDFKVDTINAYPTGSGTVRISSEYTINEEQTLSYPVEFTSMGYPFYAGRMDYKFTFEANDEIFSQNDIVLKIGEYNGCCATVTINGKYAGSIDRDPYELSIKEHLKNGENHITISLCSTIRNMIGPNRVPNGDESGCSLPKWDHPMKDNDMHDDVELIPFGIDDISIILKED